MSLRWPRRSAVGSARVRSGPVETSRALSDRTPTVIASGSGWTPPPPEGGAPRRSRFGQWWLDIASASGSRTSWVTLAFLAAVPAGPAGWPPPARPKRIGAMPSLARCWLVPRRSGARRRARARPRLWPGASMSRSSSRPGHSPPQHLAPRSHSGFGRGLGVERASCCGNGRAVTPPRSNSGGRADSLRRRLETAPPRAGCRDWGRFRGGCARRPGRISRGDSCSSSPAPDSREGLAGFFALAAASYLGNERANVGLQILEGNARGPVRDLLSACVLEQRCEVALEVVLVEHLGRG